MKRVSFVYSCYTNDLEKAKTGLKDAIDFFFMVVKKQNMNLIGHLLLDYLKDRQFIGPLQLLDERCKT